MVISSLPLTSSILSPHGRAATNPSISASEVDDMSPRDHSGESPSTSTPETTRTNKDVRDGASLVGVDQDVRLDRHAVDSTPRSRNQPSTPLGTGPARGLYPLGMSVDPEVPQSPHGTRQSLVFNPLILNSVVRVPPPPPTAQGRLQHPGPSDSGGIPDEPQRTDARPSLVCRRFTYPDTYQEALWLLDSVGDVRERRRIADHADDAPCSRRSHTEEEEGIAESAWRRKDPERYYSEHQDRSRRGPGMDGAGSEIQNPEANASCGPHPADVVLAPRSAQALDGQGDPKNPTTRTKDKPPTSSVNTQLGKVDKANRQGEMHSSVMYPARVRLYLGRPRSLQDGQRPVPCSLYPPRGLSQGTRSENDVGIIDDAFRIRRPLQFVNTCGTVEISRDTPADESTPGMTTLYVRSDGPGLPGPGGQPSSPGPDNILGQDGAMRSPSQGLSRRGYFDEEDNKPDATER